MELTGKLREEGFKQEANVDEDYPAFKGEYKGVVTELRVHEKEDSKAYVLTVQVANTLSGDVRDGRLLSKWYNLTGKSYDGTDLTEEQAVTAVKKLLNDLFTMSVELDVVSDSAMEASFGKAKDAVCFVRAWTRESKGKTYQNWVIKQEKNLKKESKEDKGNLPF